MSEEEALPKVYAPEEAEARWYAFWESENLFHADANDPRPAYTIAIPPPNVTGSLHMGHACRTTFEDVLIRYKRMCGFNALWIPGTDHAGIATQVVVERQLSREGTSRHALGRQKFIARVWQWKEESGGRILEQLRHMGASCDWSRTKFTMQDDMAHAVREAFVRLYEQGLIYRATRLVNWDVEAQTVLSDLEVEQQENVEGELFDFAYPLADGSGELVVSTTRPETMLGDTGIAVHPDDARYKKFHGKFVRHPFVERNIPIITDAQLVDPKFGTGVVKVTPAHDHNDFATGKRHKLEEINILNLNGTMNENAGAFAGMDRFKARKAVKAKLEELGLARGSKKHVMTLPRSQRSGTIVEPIISTQWFVRMQPLAEPAMQAVRTDKIQILPEEWKKTYFHWLENIQDWCISRQLWWGHSIPAWYCQACGALCVSREELKVCSECRSDKIEADPDVLDTWFSSALWPFSTLGWPNATQDLQRFYPTSDMETGYDILFFWVARMIMLGMHFMGDVPFKRVLLAGLVTDERGEKMSKVKGNVIDPLDVIHGATLAQLIEKAQQSGTNESGIKYIQSTYPEGFIAYGADALRMTLLSYSPQARRIALSIKRVEGYRNFANKLWNASRYTLMQIKADDTLDKKAALHARALANRWILSRLAYVIDHVREHTESYRLDEASSALYHFVWDEFCDWYVELSKPLLESSDAALVTETRAVLLHTLETTLRLLHPMMPHITEEIWQKLPKPAAAAKSIMIAHYPTASADARADGSAERDILPIQALITSVRAIRAEHDVPRSRELEVYWHASDADIANLFAHEQPILERVAYAKLMREPTDARLANHQSAFANAAIFVNQGFRGVVPHAVDTAKERARVERELAKIQKDLDTLEKKLKNASFVDRAPSDVVAATREQVSSLQQRRQELQQSLNRG